MNNRMWYMLGPRLGWRHRWRMRIYRLMVWLRLRKTKMTIRVYDE